MRGIVLLVLLAGWSPRAEAGEPRSAQIAPEWCEPKDVKGCLIEVHRLLQQTRELGLGEKQKEDLDKWSTQAFGPAFHVLLDDLQAKAGQDCGAGCDVDFATAAVWARKAEVLHAEAIRVAFGGAGLSILGDDPIFVGEGSAGWCRGLPGDVRGEELAHRPAHYVFCVDARQQLVPAGAPVGQWPNPLPHQDVVVRVLHAAGDPVEVKVEGQRGVFIPETVTFEAAESKADENKAIVANTANGGSSPQRWQLTDYHFGQFLPGEVTVRVQRPKELQSGVIEQWRTLAGAWERVESSWTAPKSDELKKAKDALAAIPAGQDKTAAEKKVAEEETRASIEENVKLLRTGFATLAARMELLRDARYPTFPGGNGLVLTLKSIEGVLDQLPSQISADVTAGAYKSSKGAIADARAHIATALEIIELAPTGDVMLTAPLQIERTFMGVVRVGAAVATAGATSGNFSLADLGDGRSAITSNSSAAEFELVLGYTQLFHRRPRSAAGFRVGATAALGLASVQLDTDLELTALRSLYLGFEFGWDKFAIAPTLALRQVDRLEQQYQVGMAVPSSTDPRDLVAPRFGIGFGIIVYAPEIARVRY